MYLSTRIKLRSFLKKDVEEYLKRYEALLSLKTCVIIVYTFLWLSCKILARILPFDERKVLKDLNYNLIVKRELGMITGWEWPSVGSGVLVQNGNKTFKSLLWP